MVDIFTQVKILHIFLASLGVTVIQGGYVFQKRQQKYDWLNANKNCDLPDTEDLCDGGICDAKRLRDLLEPGTSGNVSTWVRIHYKINETSKIRHDCYVYFKNYTEVKFLGTNIEDNSPEKCSNVCGFGSQVFYMLEEYCFCTQVFENVIKGFSPVKKDSCSLKCAGSNSFFCGGPIHATEIHNYPVYLSRYSLSITDPKVTKGTRSTYCVYATTWNDSFKIGKNCSSERRCLKKIITGDDDEFVSATYAVMVTTVESSKITGERVSTASKMGNLNHTSGLLLTSSAKERPDTTNAYEILTMLQTSFESNLANSTNMDKSTRIFDDSKIGIYVGAALAFICVICAIVIILLIIKKRKQKSKRHEIKTVYRIVPNDEGNVSLLPIQPSNTEHTSQTRQRNNILDTETVQSENEGQYDHLDRDGQRQLSVTTSDDNMYDHADTDTQEVTYGYSRTDRNRKCRSIEGDDIYDHTNDNIYNETRNANEDFDDHAYDYESTEKNTYGISERESGVIKDIENNYDKSNHEK